MKKIYLLLVMLAFCYKGSAQTLNEPANWPNPEWTLTGSYSSASGALEASPLTTPNFAFDDDDAGSSSNDAVSAESPVIDLTAAHTAGETSLKITVEYFYRKNSNVEIMQFEYWNADTSAWVFWSSVPGNDSNNTTSDLFCTGTKTSYVSSILSVFNFTPTQLSGFRYRIRWDDNINSNESGYQWGFCFNSPTLQSLSCAHPEGLNLISVTTNTATLGWTVNPAVTLYNIEYGAVGFEQGSGTVVTGATNPVTIIDLDPQQKYQYYAQSNCGTAGLSDWSGPFTFMTACEPVDDFNQNFDLAVSGMEMPECWTSIVDTENQYAYVQVIDYFAASNPNSVELYNEGDATAGLFLVSANVSSMTNKRVKFKAIANNSGVTLQVGTMTSPSNPATFTPVQTKVISETFTEYFVTLNGSTGNYVAFKHGLGGEYRSILIDNIVFEDLPTAAPECVADVLVAPHESCGNFPTAFTWTAVEGADGYRIRIGTTPGGNDVVNNVDLGSVTQYSLVAMYDTEYYYTVTAYNAFSDAVGCTEDIFVTAPDGCYCTSEPASNDELGITNVQLGQTDFAIEDLTYIDKTEDGSVELPRSISSNLQVTFATGYDYHTNVWIDFNDDYNFDSNELVFQGESNDDSPTTLNASFIMPATALLGEHRMRIGSADAGQEFPNPCYSDTYGVTVDLLVNVVETPSCVPPTNVMIGIVSSNTASVNWTSSTGLYNIEYGNSPLVLGSGTTVNGLTASNYDFTLLEAQTTYQFYIQSNCGSGDLSSWAGPFTFKTTCNPFNDFTQEFTDVPYQKIPECWAKIQNVDNEYGFVGSNDNDEVQLYNSDDDEAELLLITPELTDLPLNTHRIKFNAYGYGDDHQLLVGTMTNFADPSTFSLVQTITLTDTSAEYSVPFTSSASGKYVAFKHGVTDIYQTIVIDDFVWEALPTVVPSCVEDVLVTPDATCGNYETLFEWQAAEGADGYKLTIGTTSGGSDVLNGVNLGNVLEYSFVGNFDTTYYYTLIAFNTVGSAVGCIGDSFVTAPDGCYCVSEPISVDGLGITNVQLGTTDFALAGSTYYDKTDAESIEFSQGANVNLQVTLSTNDEPSGYDYDTNVWIDFNDDYNFDASELVFQGTSIDESPTTLDASFDLSPTATLGEHRMRIGAADNGQFFPDPCYSDTYGVTVDFVIKVVSLSNQEFNPTTLKVYPNPVKNILFLEYDKNISNVEVYNLIGQSIIAKAVNANQSQIDMSSLAAGTYLVKVTSDNLVRTIKVLKQ